MHLFMYLVGNSCNGRNGRDQCFKVQRRKWNWLGHELRRGCEQPFYGIRVDTRRWRGRRETKDHLGKDCQKRQRQSRVEELECGQDGGM